MRITLIVVVGALMCVACDGPPPPPPPPPPPTTTTSEPVTTTVIERQPEDYIALGRGARIIYDVEVESRSDIYLSIHSGVRDEEYAATHCAALVPGQLMLTAEELLTMAANGRELIDQWERKWRDNLSTVNKRCDADERFCGRTNVLKTNWEPYLRRLAAQRQAANLNRERAQADPVREVCSYDSVAGWCRCRKQHGGVAE